MTILVTGAAGFIGSNFVLEWLGVGGEPVVSLDALTYAGNLDSLSTLEDDPRHAFVRGDISDAGLVSELLARHRPRAVLNFAAESHVDRSIEGPEAFVKTNVLGTQRLLEAVRAYWGGLPKARRSDFRFLHVSTDEVYGTLEPGAPAFTEAHRYEPNSPYSASKAASDHLVRAYHHTYGLPVLTTNCSNNYGPRQFPEKLIPLMIRNALALQPLPVYGDGLQVRDWLYVGDHCAAIRAVLERGRPGEVYNVGGLAERTNITIVHAICDILDEIRPLPARCGIASRRELVTHVRDRPGHDRRYAVDVTKIGAELGWHPAETLETGLRRTVQWYINSANWVERAASGAYRDWIRGHYGCD